jgi:hypothetical protein
VISKLRLLFVAFWAQIGSGYTWSAFTVTDTLPVSKLIPMALLSVDVWHLLGLDPYDRSRPEQRRLTEVMRVLGWRRKIIRHNAERVGRGFRRGLDTRTIFVFRCPVTQEIYHIGHEPQPTAVEAILVDAKNRKSSII